MDDRECVLYRSNFNKSYVVINVYSIFGEWFYFFMIFYEILSVFCFLDFTISFLFDYWVRI